MSSQKFSSFLSQLAESLRDQKGPELAYLLKPTSEHGKGIIKDFRGNITVCPTCVLLCMRIPNTRHNPSETILVVLPGQPGKSLGRNCDAICPSREPLREEAHCGGIQGRVYACFVSESFARRLQKLS